MKLKCTKARGPCLQRPYVHCRNCTAVCCSWLLLWPWRLRTAVLQRQRAGLASQQTSIPVAGVRIRKARRGGGVWQRAGVGVQAPVFFVQLA